MNQKKLWLLLALVLLAGAGVLLLADRHTRLQVIQSMTATASVPTETPAPTETPLPTETPTEAPTEVPAEEPTAEPIAAEVPQRSAAEWRSWPVLPEGISDEIKTLYREGISEGNSAYHFSKVGDSNTVMPSFLGCFDNEITYDLGPYSGLADVIENFRWSFSRNSYAAKNGITAYELDIYHWYTDDTCWPYESATTCEYRLHKPSIAFIALGTNDALLDISIYEEHMRSLVQKTLDRKIVPILLTKADETDADGSFNRVTAQIALDYNVPLCNLWRAMHELPNNGLKAGDVHPTSSSVSLCNFANDDLQQYGWTVRNLTALQALDRVWRLLNDYELPLD